MAKISFNIIKRGDSVFKEFKEFAMKGNVIDLAIGVIIGGAFGKIVSSLVNDMIMPLLSLILGYINFKDLKFVIRPAAGNLPELAVTYGMFIQNVIDFLIIAWAIFLCIKFLNSFKRKKEQEEMPNEPPKPSDEVLLLTEIRDLLKRSPK